MSKTYRKEKKDIDSRKNGKKIRKEREKKDRRLENKFQTLRGEIDYELAENLDLDIDDE